MNVLSRRCSCGSVFALVSLRDRATTCVQCQRSQAASMQAQRDLQAVAGKTVVVGRQRGRAAFRLGGSDYVLVVSQVNDTVIVESAIPCSMTVTVHDGRVWATMPGEPGSTILRYGACADIEW